MPRPLAVAAAHIVENIDRIARYISGKTEHEYLRDPLLSDAVERCIERISEASRSIPEDVKAINPTVPWADIARVGNILRHKYDAVAVPTIWQIAAFDAPALRLVMIKIAASAQARDSGQT